MLKKPYFNLKADEYSPISGVINLSVCVCLHYTGPKKNQILKVFTCLLRHS